MQRGEQSCTELSSGNPSEVRNTEVQRNLGEQGCCDDMLVKSRHYDVNSCVDVQQKSRIKEGSLGA
jgi:hypothetical protein